VAAWSLNSIFPLKILFLSPLTEVQLRICCQRLAETTSQLPDSPVQRHAHHLYKWNQENLARLCLLGQRLAETTSQLPGRVQTK
jgi:hypothetical protein